MPDNGLFRFPGAAGNVRKIPGNTASKFLRYNDNCVMYKNSKNMYGRRAKYFTEDCNVAASVVCKAAPFVLSPI